MVSVPEKKSRPFFSLLLFFFSLLICFLSYFPFDVWFFDFLIQFQIHIGIVFLAVSGSFLVCKKRRISFLQLLVAIAMLLPGIVIYSNINQKNCEILASVSPIKVMTFNRYRENKQYDLILNTVQRAKPDVLLLLETDKELFIALNNDLNQIGLKSDESFLEEHKYRSLLYSRLPIKEMRLQKLPNKWQHVLYVQIEHPYKDIHFFGIHTQSPKTEDRLRARDRHIQSLADYIRGYVSDEKAVIVAGDFNSVPWHPVMQAFMVQANLFYRIPYNVIGTWPSGVFSVFGVMIDQIYFNEHFSVDATRALSGSGSDHFPVFGQLNFCE